MSRMPRDLNARFTYKDYRTWSDNERWELIDGVPYNMTPAPSTKHQEILGELYQLFAAYLKGKPCKAYLSPFDVRLPSANEQDEDISSVVQPDLTVVCDPSKIDEHGCKGTPDLIIEILSPATMKKDLGDKLRLYERAGVPEYWVVHPYDQTALIFNLNQGIYGTPTFYKVPDEVRVIVFPDLVIPLPEVFAI
ncbi:Uma2 family endonuclease [Desulfitobacterium sp.]|uniref:Uma2 family endonuclease n=1 Tax=Desulfitobacterium sp. TaxID=49981 RepID=UPI002B201546|nr:Uma2 family endonuclease [Desulfitobacterium sp.]MEA4902178.1 Uma2 family endonuclease [Desulfitobacterium sp.]